MKQELREFRLKILDIFVLSGIVIDAELLKDDFDVREYILDSISFISAVVEIENTLKIELPDEILQYDNLASFYAFSRSIWELYLVD